MKKLWYPLAALILMIGLNNISLAANDKPLTGKKLVVTVKSGDITEAGMGLPLAHSAVKKGAQVTVVLGANASWHPAKKGGQNIFAAKGKTPREMLTAIIKDDGSVYLCSLCAEYQSFTQDDLIDGVEIVKSIKIWNKLFEEDARSLSF